MGPTPGSREVFDLGIWNVEVRSSSTSGTMCQVNNKGTLFRASEDGDDPVLGQFLGFLAADITRHPEQLQAVDAGLVQRLRALVGGVDVDLDAALSEDDE
ncbi:type II toxin-antitoxin system PrlF family antitoxin [Candidatus Saccharibacteria bacterium]|nr:type II toxin-antitoxin system PrlF family antitoxin [Candidatus Saccharibacteria bacterium]